MVMFKVFEQGMNVNGQTINSIAEAFSSVKFIVDSYFRQTGLPKNSEIKDTEWYSQQAYLDAFKLIAERVGTTTMFTIGKKIPENAQFPPDINNIEKALASIDIAYHMNHKNASGQVLFNNGTMLEGIGHYDYTKLPGNKAEIKCENPYHCDFDKGIITTMATRFNQNAKIKHDDSKGCRKTGSSSCHFIVEW
jgi:hypothetical protein